MSLNTGEVIVQRYRIVKLLGQGGFGAVYRAWDLNVKRPCAVKENLDTSPEAQRQFGREATILANLSHPNLPRVTDHFTVENQGQYLVMDFVDGEDLGSRIQREGALPLKQSCEWISQVADALSYLHSRQPPVVHRDIKPANIRITPEGKAVLVDFGLVKVFDPNLQTTMGARAVTPGYAPPEQYGHGKTDNRSDIYALGATLYKLLTGVEPLESVQRMAGSKIAPAHQLNPTIAPHIGQVIECAMNLDPIQRYQTAMEFKTDLNAVESTVFVSPPANVSFQPAARPPRSDFSAAPDFQKTSNESGKSKKGIFFWLAIVGGIFLCVCLVVGGSLIIFSEEDQLTELTNVVRTQTAEFMVAQKTSTAQAQSAVNHQATLDASRVLIYGPVSGSLYHEPEDGMIEGKSASVDLRNFIVEAIFYNPYGLDTGTWDYGFILRHEEQNVQFRFAVKSDQTWKLMNNNFDPNGIEIASGTITQLNTNENGSNKIRLEFVDEIGYFYLNNDFVDELDLSVRINSGDIYICTGIFENDELTGEVTDYKDFTIWSLPIEN
jgi:eukaryotic-like serine/threonine-protein kinase